MSKEAMKLAKDFIESMAVYTPTQYDENGMAICKALEEALAKQEQGEPVAFEEWLANQHGDPEEIGFLQALRIAYISGHDSITTPPQRTWVGLTTKDQKEIQRQSVYVEGAIRMTEAKLKEKNT
jgi:hypothetical protein